MTSLTFDQWPECITIRCLLERLVPDSRQNSSPALFVLLLPAQFRAGLIFLGLFVHLVIQRRIRHTCIITSSFGFCRIFFCQIRLPAPSMTSLSDALSRPTTFHISIDLFCRLICDSIPVLVLIVSTDVLILF